MKQHILIQSKCPFNFAAYFSISESDSFSEVFVCVCNCVCNCVDYIFLNNEG